MPERVILTIGTKKGLFVAQAPKSRRRFTLNEPVGPGVDAPLLIDTPERRALYASSCNAFFGMIITQGGLFSGWALYLDRGKPVFHSNFVDVAHYEVVGKDPLAAGQHAITMDFAYDGGGIGKGGTATISVDGKEAAKGRVEAGSHRSTRGSTWARIPAPR